MSLIVIIEDDMQSARLAARLLKRAGHEVVTAEDGEAGIAAVLARVPDAVLVDLGLPDIDGETVVAMLRDHLENLCIIAFTAYPDDIAQQLATMYGCDGLINKPIDTRQFAHQVVALLRKPAEPVQPL